jgi:protoheme IX farnesyltransferase
MRAGNFRMRVPYPSVTLSEFCAPLARWRDYAALLKPRVMSLVVFTGMVGMFLAPGHLHPMAAFVAILSIALGGGAAGAMNMWLERDSDARMDRTRHRPIPSGRISAGDALHFAILCAVTSVVLMACAANLLAAALLLLAILFYVLVYTLWLKPRTPMNIVIGGAAGALPPVIGWVAVTGNISILPVLLFFLIFLWTPPHFWALALVMSDDYRRAGIPMLPVTAGRDVTVRHIAWYTLLLLPVSLLPYVLDLAGGFYASGALALGLGFIYYSLRLRQTQELRHAMPVFTYSLFYLFGVFALLMLDRVVR